MGLENVLNALELAMNGKLEKLDEKLISDQKVRETLTTYFSEQQTRPQLIKIIRVPSLMYDYLNLSLDEREKLNGFRQDYTSYLNGDGLELNLLSVNSENVRKLIRAQRYINHILTLFDFYLEERKKGRLEGIVFNSWYLAYDKKLNKNFENLGMKVVKNADHNLKNKGKAKGLLVLASEANHEIKKYSTFKELLKIDGIRQILRIFDFYLEHRENKDRFNLAYMMRNNRVKKRFGNLGERLSMNWRNNFKNEGGSNYLFQLAAQERPEILKYQSYKEPLISLTKLQKRLLNLFDVYLECRGEGVVFHLQSINRKLLRHYGPLGKNIYKIAKKYYRSDDAIEKLIESVSDIRPEIKKYASPQGVLEIDGASQLLRMFDFYLEHKREGQMFCITYLRKDTLLSRKFGSLGKRLCQNAGKHFPQEKGMNHLVNVAAQQRPEILEHWSYDEKRGKRK